MTNPIPGRGAMPAPLPAPVPFPIRPVPAPNPDQPPLTWRNMLCDVSGDTLLLIAPAAGLEKAAELDGELLTCCAAAAALDRRAYQAVDGIDQSDASWDAAVGAGLRLVAEWHGLVRRATQLPARTPEGLRAKAVLADSYLAESEDAAGIGRSLARDIMGRGRA